MNQTTTYSAAEGTLSPLRERARPVEFVVIIPRGKGEGFYAFRSTPNAARSFTDTLMS